MHQEPSRQAGHCPWHWKKSVFYKLPNIQYPPAKRLRRSFGALAKAEVLYGGQVQQGMSNDEIFSAFVK